MNLFRRFKASASALMFGLVCMLTVGTASAQATDTGTTVAAAITAANPQVEAVIGAMAGALVIIVVWSLIKRAWGK